MLGSYLPVLVMLIVATAIALVMMGASYVLGPKRPTHFKQDTYESGMTPVGSARERFPVQFYLIAMLFIIFDIETIFLYPWAVAFRNPAISPDRATKVFLLGEMAVFVVILFVGYAYVYGRGALDWSASGREPGAEEPGIYDRRPSIRFGNEDSGSVRLPASAPSPGTPDAVPAQGEQTAAPVPVAGGSRS